ncbi:HNH endonuclease [Micromonospora trifolii]|uniref:HNH endonuclease n=1 Tax=Micromonospora trifolii TaxID=2911208 RepID=UPI003D2F031B
MTLPQRRDSAARKRYRRTFMQHRPPCHICGEPIDWEADHLDPRSLVVDHIVPVSRGGTHDRSNVAAAHRACNLAKGNGEGDGAKLRRSGSLQRRR